LIHGLIRRINELESVWIAVLFFFGKKIEEDMTFTTTPATKAAIGAAIITSIGASGKLVILDAGNVVLAEIPLPNPAAVVQTDRIVFDVDPVPEDASANADGAPAKGQVQDGTGATLLEGVAGAASTVANVTVTSGSNVITAGAGAFTAALVGRTVVGNGIPADTFVQGLSGSSLVLSKNATASGTESLVFNPDIKTQPQLFAGQPVRLTSFVILLP
jgi:hypothetical protein